MAAAFGLMDVECDAPPYEVVRACTCVGLHRPLDVVWHHRARYAARRARQAGLFSLAAWRRLLGLAEPQDSLCGCGRAQPPLRRFTVVFASGQFTAYEFGQCPHCGAVFWDGPE